MAYGQKIAKLRKEANMTQMQLGTALNVSAQAVSKWEHDIAEPDLTTIKKMSEIFKISIDDFLDIDLAKADDNNNELSKDISEQITSAVDGAMKQNQQSQPIGFCVSCGSMVYKDNAGQVTPEVRCKRCYEIEQRRLASEKDAIQSEKFSKLCAEEKLKRKSIIWSSIVTAIIFAINIIIICKTKDSDKLGYKIVFTILMIYIAYAFISELILDEGPVADVLMWFISLPIKLPGIIFTWDLDGLVFLVVMKIVFAIIGFLLGLLAFAAGVVIGGLIAPFTFPFSIAKVNKRISNLKGE